MKPSTVIFASGPVGQKFLKLVLEFHKKNKLNIDSVVVCENSNNPFYAKGTKDVVTVFSQKHGLEVLFKPDDLLAKGRKYDIGLSLSNFHILRQKHIDLFKNGAINFHGAPVLWYRGSAAPAFHIMGRDIPQWGYVYLNVDKTIDGGGIISQVIYDIPAGLSSSEINETAIEHAIKDFPSHLDNFISGNFKIIPQSEFKEFTNNQPLKRTDLYGGEITDIKITDKLLAKLLRVYDWPEILNHPLIKVNGKKVRLLPEKTYQEMLSIFRKFKEKS